MKITYVEQIENHMAWKGSMMCGKCGAHEYDIVEQLQPKTANPWYIRCPQCGFESTAAPTRESAIAMWKRSYE